MITNGLAEEHWHSIQAKFYAILTKNGNYTRIFVGDTFGQSEMVRGGSHEKYSVYRFGILTSDVVSLFASFHTISGAIH